MTLRTCSSDTILRAIGELTQDNISYTYDQGKCYRLVIQRQKRTNSDLDLWEGEYTYRCILTNDYESSARDIVEFYNRRTKQAQSDVCISYGLQGGGKATKWINLRGGKERIFDDMNNGFGWSRLPKSFMAENTVCTCAEPGRLYFENGVPWHSRYCPLCRASDSLMLRAINDVGG